MVGHKGMHTASGPKRTTIKAMETFLRKKLKNCVIQNPKHTLKIYTRSLSFELDNSVYYHINFIDSVFIHFHKKAEHTQKKQQFEFR